MGLAPINLSLEINKTIAIVNYELILIENLIEQLSTESVNLQLKDLEEFLFHEKERLKKAFIKEAFDLEKRKQVARFAQKHQRVLTRMLDDLLNAPDIQLTDEIKIVYESIEEILSFIENYFAKYFDLDENVPAKYCQTVKHELKNQLAGLRLPPASTSNNELVDIAICPINEFIKSGQNISFRSLAYYRQLIATIQSTMDPSSARVDNQALRRSLIYLNLNSYRFFNYLTSQISTSLQEKETLGEQIQYLALQLKVINQAQIKPAASYKAERTTIKSQMSCWILEELAYLEKRKQLSLVLQGEMKDLVEKDFKIAIDLSVQQWAYFVKLLVDTKVIKNKNLSELIRFISANTSTKRAECISQESFRTKYYNTEDSAKQFVKDLIIKLLNEVRKP